MNLLTAEKLEKSYSEKILFQEVSFSIEEGDKIGIIGVNGTGKSTLMKIVAGEEVPGEGRLIKKNGLTIGYLRQSPSFGENVTVLEAVFQGDYPLMKLLRAYEDAIFAVELYPGDKEREAELIRRSGQMDAAHAWDLESEAKSILTKLGITAFHKKVSLLSGGQQKRVAMAAALIAPVDLLLLDEPTNHIDNATVDWLEGYLAKRNGALMMITHDRYFLDRVTNKIVELDEGRLFTYQGNYSNFLESKAVRMETEQANERKRQNTLRRELAWIRRGAQARSTKQKARIERYEVLSAQKGPQEAGAVEITTGAARLGRKTIELEHIGKYYEGKPLIHDFSYIFLRDDRIGIIGPNGVGKTTLLSMIAGLEAPDTGEIAFGETVQIGLFAQDNGDMDDDLRVIEYIRNTAEYINTKEGKLSASQMLENFLFPSSAQWTPIRKLSGGEKRRLFLLKVLMEAPNVLLLDEPTNDLDVETLAILEAYLDDFPGIVVTVSHDRYFLDRVVRRIFAFEEEGHIQPYEGGYADYAEAIKERAQGQVKPHSGQEKAPVVRKREQKLKFSFKEQKEYETIEGEVAASEEALEKNARAIEAAGSDYIRLEALLAEKETLEAEYDRRMERWIYLQELAEKIEAGE